MTVEPLLVLENVGRVFGPHGAETSALRDISVTVQRGDFVAVTGTSGSGKSTLLNILGLLDTPSTGRYLIDGEDTSTMTERQRDRLRGRVLSFVFQASHVTADEDAARNTALGLRVLGWPRPEQQRTTAEALERYGLAHVAHTLGRDLSGGERARVALARATAKQPDVLLADEPTGALDTANSERVFRHLVELNNRGVTVILITHNPDLAARVPRRIHLDDGSVASDEGEIRTAPEVPPAQEQPAAIAGSRRRRALAEFTDALSRVLSQTGRTATLLIAFMLGTAGLVGALGLGQSASAQISQRITAAGLDEVTVSIPDVPGASVRAKIDPGPVLSALAGIDGVKQVGFHAVLAPADAGLTRLGPQVAGTSRFTGRIEAATSGYLATQRAHVVPETAGASLDDRSFGPVAIVGDRAADTLGLPAQPGASTMIWLGRTPVTVVGVLTGADRDSDLRDAVIVSASTLDVVHSNDPKYLVRTRDGYPAAVADAAPTTVNPGNPGAVRVETVANLHSLQKGVGSDLAILLGVLALFLLALACLSAAGSMYLTVRTRAPEVALRRAMGASRWSIWRMFLYEGFFVGLAGGIAGSALGLGIVLAGSIAQGWTAVLDPKILLWGILAGMLTGLVSAAVPARAAARRAPAEAIRG